MASKAQIAVGAALDEAAIQSEGRESLRQLALLVSAIDRRNLWVELAWEPEQASAAAHRDVARVRRALEQAGE